MSDRKDRISITVDHQLSAYAEELVESGRASSVSAAFSAAMEEKVERDRRLRALWRDRAAQADPERVARMAAHVTRQVRELAG